MRKTSSGGIKASILEFCESCGIRPGSLLIAKEHIQLEMIFGDLDNVIAEMPTAIYGRGELRRRGKTISVNKGSVLLFVDGHGVRLGAEDGPWDFWYEVLFDEQTAYVHAFELGRAQFQLFDIRTP